MKRIFTLSATLFIAALFFAGCTRTAHVGNEENYWLSKERGEVVYSDAYCSYYVVETNLGYTVIQTYGSYKPFEGAVLYGNFSSRGTRDMYNQSSGVVFTGIVTDYWLSYVEAQDALDYYCPFGKGTGAKREFKKSSYTKEGSVK
ncbi:MAG: hypothetical protein NTW29_08980 [Bacteroidetes bacterium]|nr:hypothetical protein [Bacteroidota bacterium]